MMIKLPKHWQRKKIGEIANINMGQSPESMYINESNKGVPFCQGNTKFGYRYLNKPNKFCTKPTKIANKNDVLLSVRAPVGALNIASYNLCIGRGLSALYSKNNNNHFLYYLLLSLKNKISRCSQGTTFESINRNDIEDLKCNIPTDIEQYKIAEILSTCDDCIETTEKLIEAKQRLKKGLMQKLLTGKIRFKEFIKSKQTQKTRFGDFPKDWEIKKI